MAVQHLYSLDTEGHLIRPGLLAPPLVCVSYAHRTGAGSFKTGLLGAEDGCAFFEELLATPSAAVVFHNAPFDLAVLCIRRPRLIKPVFAALEQGRIRDTKLRQELLDIHSGRRQQNGRAFVCREGIWQAANYSLAGLVKLYTGRDRFEEKKNPDSWRLRYATLEHLPVESWPDAARQYALDDASDPIEVYEAQSKEAEAIGYLDADFPGDVLVNEIEQTKAAWALHLMSVWGIRTDGDAVSELEERLLDQQGRNRKTLVKAGLLKKRTATAQERREGKVDFYEDTSRGLKAMRWATDKKLVARYVERVYARRGEDAPRTEPSSRFPEGQTATDKDSLYQSGSRLLKLFADGGGVDKVIGTYLPVLKQGVSIPINVRYNVLVNSGRTSAYGEKDKATGEVSGCNIQNLPTGRRVGGVRECFVPRPGYLFVSVDYETLELRCLAQVCLWLFGESRMAQVINEGRDIHSSMAAEMIGVSYEELERGKKKKGSREKLARDCAKVANFGLPGGLGAESLVEYARVGYGVILTVERALELKRDWLRMWPEMRLYFSYVNTKVGFGEAKLTQFWSGRVRGGVGYCDGCNTLFQGLAADGAKRAMFRIAQEMYSDEASALFGSRLVAFIHDEFIAEIPEDLAHEASTRLAALAVEEMRKVTPDIVSKAEPALMRRWFKDAQAVRGDDGLLLPWAPDLPVTEEREKACPSDETPDGLVH